MFHVPEMNRDYTHPRLRSDFTDGNNGAFHIESPEPGWQLFVIASDGSRAEAEGAPEGKDWEHVSVHAWRAGKQRTPNWREMAFLKDLFWDAEDTVVQFHPPRSEYVNMHPYTLHLWRWKGGEFPRPHPTLVGYWRTRRDAQV